MNPTWQRIHPRAILADFLMGLGRLAFVIVLFVFLSLQGNRENDTTEIIAGIVGLFAVIGPVLNYLFFKYALHQGNLLVEKNVFGLWRDQRTIPVDRIQNINLKRPLVHQLLGLVIAEIETGSGSQAEAKISGITEGQADELKIALSRMVTKQSGVAPAPPMPGVQADPGPLARLTRQRSPDQLIYKATAWELFVAGALGNRWWVFIAFIAGVPAFLQPLLTQIPAVRQVLDQSRQGDFTGIIIAVLVVFTIGWGLSIFQTMLRYWNFELAIEENRFIRSYGLTEHIENVLPVKRIQVIEVTQTYLEKTFDLAKVKAATAGGFGADQRQMGNDLLSPILAADQIPRILAFSLPGIWLKGLRLFGVPVRAITYCVLYYLLPKIAICAVAAYWIKPLPAAGLLVAWILLSIVKYKLWHAKAGYSLAKDVLIVYDGVLGHITHYLPTAKIQNVSMSQGPLLKAFGLAVVTARTAAQGMAAVDLPPLPIDEAMKILEELHQHNRTSPDTLLDGL